MYTVLHQIWLYNRENVDKIFTKIPGGVANIAN